METFSAFRNRENIIISIKNKLYIFLFSVLNIISCSALYSSDTTLSSQTLQRILIAVVYAVTLIILGMTIIGRIRITFLPIIPFAYVLFIHYNSYAENSLNLLLALELALFLVMSPNMHKDLFIIFKKCLVIMSVIGIVCYILYIFRIPLYRTVPYYDKSSSVYIDFAVSYLCSYNGMTRLCGIFNEPGFFGTIIAFVLCTDKIELNKRDNKILFCAGVLTFSLAFFMLLVIYFILKCYKKPKLMIPLAIMVLVYFFVLPYVNTGIPVLQHLIERTSFVNGSLSGDNRSNSLIDGLFIQVITSNDRWWGMGGGYTGTLVFLGGIATYKTYIINYGILGSLFIYGLLLIPALYKAKKNLYTLFFVACFFISIYQRPNPYLLPYFIVLFGGIEYMNSNVLRDRE